MQTCHLLVFQDSVHINPAAVCWQLRKCHVIEFGSMKLKEKDGSFARNQRNVGVFTQVTTFPTQHCLPLMGCVPYIMFFTSRTGGGAGVGYALLVSRYCTESPYISLL